MVRDMHDCDCYVMAAAMVCPEIKTRPSQIFIQSGADELLPSVQRPGALHSFKNCHAT